MQQKEDSVPQSEHTVLNPHTRFKKLTMILISVLLLTMFGLGGYWLGARGQQSSTIGLFTKLGSSLSPTAASIQQRSPSPSLAIRETTSWKTYEDTTLAVTYPLQWSLFKHVRLNYYSIADDEFHPENEFRINIVKKIPPYYKSENPTDEEIIEITKDYEVNSTSGLGNYNPQEINKSEMIINGRLGIKYVFRLDFSDATSPNYATWVFVPHRQQLIKIYLEGKNQKVLEQILSSIKFLN